MKVIANKKEDKETGEKKKATEVHAAGAKTHAITYFLPPPPLPQTVEGRTRWVFPSLALINLLLSLEP